MKRRHYRIDLKNNLFDNYQQDEKTFAKDTRHLIVNHQYLYIDINQRTHPQHQEHLRVMDECSSSDQQDQIQKVSKHLTINLNQVTPNHSNTNRYLAKVKETSNKKDRLHMLIQEQLRRSDESSVKKPTEFDKFIKKIKNYQSNKDCLEECGNILKDSKGLFGHSRVSKLDKLGMKWRNASIDFDNYQRTVSNRKLIDHVLPYSRPIVRSKPSDSIQDISKTISFLSANRLAGSKDNSLQKSLRINTFLPKILKNIKTNIA